jgi:hypothetical protein
MTLRSQTSTADGIARWHFEAAVAEAVAAGHDPDTLARRMLGLAVAKYLENRPVEDVRAELTFVAENCDPDTDFVFTRP